MERSIRGERFGKLVVIGPSSEIRNRCHTVLCRCDCGEMIHVPPYRLWSGQYKSCGCGRGKRSVPREMIGKKFGDLTVLELTEHLSHGTRTYLCRCDCGKLTYVLPSNLKNGNTKSCDCGNETIADYKHLAEGERVSCGCAKGGPRPLDVTGRRFGRLTAIRRLDIKGRTSYKWLCQCDCGRTTQVSVANLTSGGVRSCGCLRSRPRAAGFKPENMERSAMEDRTQSQDGEPSRSA